MTDSNTTSAIGKNKIYAKVFLWVMLGLAATFAVAFAVSQIPALTSFMTAGYVPVISLVIYIALVIITGIFFKRMSKTACMILYVLITLAMGFVCGSYFVQFTLTDIFVAILITAVVFGIFGVIGMLTKIDLSKIWVYLLVLLIGLGLMELVNLLFLHNSLNILLCIIGMVLIVAYIAVDMQRLKKYAESGTEDTKVSIMIALKLYSDIVNLLLRILQLMGKFKKN